VKLGAEFFIEFSESCIVFSYTNVALLYTVPEIDARNHFYAGVLAQSQGIQYGGRVVDVAQHKVLVAFGFYFFQELFNGKQSVTKTITGMAVEEHGFDCELSVTLRLRSG
jgi:hypothetical protein